MVDAGNRPLVSRYEACRPYCYVRRKRIESAQRDCLVEVSMVDRRGFLSHFSGVAAAVALPASRVFADLRCQPLPAMPDAALYEKDEEAYWAALRKQFVIPEDEVYLNNGTVGSSPLPVLEAIVTCYQNSERMAQSEPEDYPIWGYAAWNEFRDPLAAFVGCKRDEIALLRNATEANSSIANGVDLKAGDEVVITDQEHPGGEHPWDLRAKRYGIEIKKIKLPKPVVNAAAVLNLFSEAISPRTRVIFFSHITTVTGVVLPAKEICALARSKGILSAVDGAHVPGMMKLDLHDLGCDMYSASPHKWLQATKGTGFLYARDEVIDRVWSTIATEGWNDTKLRAERFQRIGSSNVPALCGLRAAIALANEIGMERIEKRHRQNANYILKEMVQRGAESWTSPDPELRCAIAAVNVPPVQITELENWMWKGKKIRIRGGAPSKIRLSTPYYVLHKDVDRFLAAFEEYKTKKA